jgi:hypothetical protein
MAWLILVNIDFELGVEKESWSWLGLAQISDNRYQSVCYINPIPDQLFLQAKSVKVVHKCLLEFEIYQFLRSSLLLDKFLELRARSSLVLVEVTRDGVIDKVIFEVLRVVSSTKYFFLSNTFVFFQVRQQDMVSQNGKNVCYWILVFDKHPKLIHASRI